MLSSSHSPSSPAGFEATRPALSRVQHWVSSSSSLWSDWPWSRMPVRHSSMSSRRFPKTQSQAHRQTPFPSPSTQHVSPRDHTCYPREVCWHFHMHTCQSHEAIASHCWMTRCLSRHRQRWCHVRLYSRTKWWYGNVPVRQYPRSEAWSSYHLTQSCGFSIVSQSSRK